MTPTGIEHPRQDAENEGSEHEIDKAQGKAQGLAAELLRMDADQLRKFIATMIAAIPETKAVEQ